MQGRIPRSDTYNPRFLQRALRLAAAAARHGNHPFGALLAKGSRVLLTAENTVNTDHDVTRHAEMNLVSQAARQFDAETLAECTLYTSTEPCVMCTGAIYWTGIGRVVYACSAKRLASIAGGSFLVPCRVILSTAASSLRRAKRSAPGRSRRARHVEILGPFMEQEAAALHRRYWTRGSESDA